MDKDVFKLVDLYKVAIDKRRPFEGEIGHAVIG